MADIFDVIITWLTTFPNYLLVVAIIIGYIVWYFYSNKRKMEADIFQLEDFREAVYSDTESIINTFGITINAYMIKGIEPIGRISKFVHFKGLLEHGSPEELKNKKGESAEVDLWLIRIGKKGILDYILGGVKFTYLIIDNDHLDPYDGQAKRWSVKEDVSFRSYGGVYATSELAEQYINSIAFRRSLEENLSAIMNFTRKTSYIELKQAKTMERLAQSIESRQSGYDKYKKDILASDKELDEDDDE